jgi:hypothetical protein
MKYSLLLAISLLSLIINTYSRPLTAKKLIFGINCGSFTSKRIEGGLVLEKVIYNKYFDSINKNCFIRIANFTYKNI